MRYQHLVMVGGMALAMSLSLGHVIGEAQSAAANARTAAAGKIWTPSRTLDGQPDLQGVWANNNATPLERPKELAGREFLTDAEVAALKAKAGELFGGDGDAVFGDTFFQTVLAGAQGSQPAGPHKKAPGEFDEGTGDYNSFWLVSREWNNRTSLIVDPRDGKLPPMTPEAQERQRVATAARQVPAAGPEDRSLSERCITFGSPRLQAGYNSYFQIFQTSHYVVIAAELIHDARIIPIDGRPHLPPSVRQWLGDSRGHWEGNTLVVDTTNYLPKSFMTGSEKLHVIERFTRVSSDTIEYEITVNDPATWTKSWTVMMPLKQSHDQIYEYACHEGNSPLVGILAGARAEEKAAEGLGKPGSK